MKTVKKSLLSIVIAAGLAATGAYAADQKPQAPTTPAMPEQATQAINVSDKQVGDFVEAYVAVQTLNQEYATKLQATTDNPEKSQQLQKEAQSDMQAAITETGLSLDEYKQIALAANDNEQLRQRISSAINQSTTAPSDS